jgi:hypothetical protein
MLFGKGRTAEIQKQKEEMAERKKELELKAQQEKERKEKEELAKLQQLDTEARQKLQGEYKERYLFAKEIGLERQAEIARIEGITNTTFIDLEEQNWVLLKKVSMRLGYSVGGKHYNYPNLKTKDSSIQQFPGRISLGAMTRYQEVRDFFDEVKIRHFDVGTDPFMYGIKQWKDESLHFLIMMWD